MTEHKEAGGVAWTELWALEGWKINLTARGDSPVEAGEELLIAINHFYKEHGLSTQRIQSRVTELAEEQLDKEFPPIDDYEPPSQEVPEEYSLGLQERKVPAGELKPNQTYQIVAEEYDFNGQNVEFFNSNSQYPIAKQNMKGKGAEIFGNLFNGWEPDEGRHPVPGGPVKLLIKGSTNLTSAGNPYQNIVGQTR